MWKKIASLAALLSTSLTVQGCTPIQYKPIPMRTAKVPPIQDRTVLVPAPKKKATLKKPVVEGPGPSPQYKPPKMNVYGVPQ